MAEYQLSTEELARLSVDDYEAENPMRSDAVILEGTAHNGKPCRMVDNTASVPSDELQALFDHLIAEETFGISGTSVSGGSTIRIGGPQGTHIQIGEDIYRIVLFPYEARIERF